MATIQPYYPALSDIVSIDQLPDGLGFIKDGIRNVFDNIFYKNLIESHSVKGNSAFYSLDIICTKKLSFELGSTGISLVLNPADEDPDISSFSITVYWQWEILTYIRNFDLSNFSFSIEDFFKLATIISGVSEEQALNLAIRTFIIPADESPTEIEQFVSDLNTFYDKQIDLPPYGENQLSELIDRMHQEHIESTYQAIFALYISSNDIDTTKKKLDSFFSSFFPDDVESYLSSLFIPKARASLELSLAIEFPRNVLQPVYEVSGNDPSGNNPHDQYDVIPADEHGNPKVSLKFAPALFNIDSEEGLDNDLALSISTAVPAQIGDTGLIINIKDLKIDLSRKTNIAEADLDGRPPDFMGVYISEVDVILPKKWFNVDLSNTVKISGTNLLIGTGGFSGEIALTTTTETLWAKIGNWRLGFNKFDVSFRQNAISSSNIKARLEIPKFKSPSNPNHPLMVDFEGHLYESGDFALTASVPGGIEANLFDFVTINFLTLELGREQDNFFIGTSCELWFEKDVMKKIFKDQKIVIPRLRIYDNGHIEIVGGNAFIPANISLSLGPVEVAVTGIHFGSLQQQFGGEERKYNYWGFDGAISIDPLGIDARGEGIKYYYTSDNDEHGGSGDSFLHIQSIEIDLIIPGTASPDTACAIIHGMISIPDPGESPEYKGEVSLKLPKAKIAGGASLILQPRSPAFIVDAFIDLPAPIPIGPVGIYGFRGLIGFRYVAEKEAIGLVSGVDSWYDYYVHPPKGIDIAKFSSPERTKDYSAPFSIGAGAVLGTSFDSGSVLSIRAMLLLSLPALFMIEGRATILSARLGLLDDKEPPFFAFIAWGDNSLELGIGADFKMPQDTGRIIDLHAEVQAGFFFNNLSNWYVNFGTKQEPITAKVLTIVTAQSYLMFSALGIEAGARKDFELNKHFGPANVHIQAYLEMGGHISFERPQIGGYLSLSGMINIDIWIVSVSIGLDAILTVEAARPFLLYAELNISVCISFVVHSICKSFTIQIKWELDTSVDLSPIPALTYNSPASPTHKDRTKELVSGVHMLTNTKFELDFLGVNTMNILPAHITKVIPLDTFIDIKSEKGLVPNAVIAKIGGQRSGAGNFTDLVPPVKTVRGGHSVRQVKHKYSIEDIEIKAWTGTQWTNYHPYQAIIEEEDVTALRIGCWQGSGNQHDTIRILGNDPFSFSQAGEPGWFIPEQFGITASKLFCASKKEEFNCSTVLNKPMGTIYYRPRQYYAHFINGAYYTIEGGIEHMPVIDGIEGLFEEYFMKVTDEPNPFRFAKSLCFNNYNSLVIILPEASVSVKLRLTTNALGVKIKYYHILINDSTIQTQYELVNEVSKTSDDLQAEMIYENIAKPISKVIIEPRTPNHPAIQSIQTKIESLFSDTYDNSNGIVSITVPKDTTRYWALLNILETLRSEGCNKWGCITALQQICWLSLEKYEFNSTIPSESAVEQNQRDMVAAFQRTIQPVWRPNTKYYIRFRLKDEVDNVSSQAGVFDYYYGFRTVGPVGHYHKHIDAHYLPLEAKPDEYPLTSLRQYIDYNRSYPNADGSLLQAKPLFYGHQQCKINIFFSQPLVYHMLTKWHAYNGLPELNGEMYIIIKDPVTDKVIPYPLPENWSDETVPLPEAGWAVDIDPRIPLNIRLLNKYINYINEHSDAIECRMTLGEPITPVAHRYTVTLTNLKPLKLYTVIMYNAFDVNSDNVLKSEKVHQFVFQTSRYANFEEQIKSCILKDELGNEKYAAFIILLNATATVIETAFNIVTGIDDPDSNALESKYLHLFDRVTEGVLGFKPMEAAVTTEFNLLRNMATAESFAILIRNPEPFNIPKIPVMEIQGTIEVIDPFGAVDNAYKVLYSTDYAQALIMHTSKKITSTSLDFRFSYKTWNGSAYIIESTINVKQVQINL